MVDNFESKTPEELIVPIEDGFEITPSDDDELPEITRAIHVGVGGDLYVITKKGATIKFGNLPNGRMIAVRAIKVLESTTCEDIYGLV